MTSFFVFSPHYILFYCKLQMMIGSSTLQVEAPRQIKKPALFIRNVRKIGSAKVLAVMNQMNCDRVRINDKSKDVQSDLAVAFFPTEESAFQALHKLKTLRVEGVKIAVSFRLFPLVSFFFLFLLFSSLLFSSHLFSSPLSSRIWTSLSLLYINALTLLKSCITRRYTSALIMTHSLTSLLREY
jgi:hypothetical protein